MSITPSPQQPSPFTMPPLMWGSSALTVGVGPPRPWLWQGYLAPGAVTLLTSLWKAGKTTLASVLLSRLKTGGHLAGLPLAPGRAVVITEEDPQHWLRRNQSLDFAESVGWYCRPFQGRPRPAQWTAFIDGLVDLHARMPLSLVLIDPWAAFQSGNENNVASMVHALAPLQRLTARGLAVWILHHPSKDDPPIGRAARGSGALPGCVDILMEMRAYPDAGDDDRRRRLHAFSRFPETPRQLVIEWTADGTDYLARGTILEEDFTRHWEMFRSILADAPYKWNWAEIRRNWPTPDPPEKTTLHRWLQRAVDKGLLKKDGRGRRGHPFRFWLPEREEFWRTDFLALLHMPELRQPPPPSPDTPAPKPNCPS